MAPLRRPFVGGNWKCNGTKETIGELCSKFNEAKFSSKDMDVAIFPTAVHFPMVRQLLKEQFLVGSQNCSKSPNGAFTGELSVDILKDMGVNCTLIGHSERRQFFGDSDEVVAMKAEMTQKGNFMTVLCIGELLSEREAGKTIEVCRKQMEAVIPKVVDWSKIIIAYEPVWAIGTGVVATPEQAQEAHASVRSLLKEKVSEKVANEIRIIYGGSVTDANCKTLITQDDIDGFLVGGASLKPSFVDIIASAVPDNKA